MTPAPLDDGGPTPPGAGRFDVVSDPTTRRRLGTVMIVVAVVGVVVAAVGTVVAWQFVGALDDSSRQSLDATIDTLDTVDDSIDLAESVLTATTATLETAGATLEAVSASFQDASGVVDEVDDLTETVGPALDQTVVTLRQLESVASTIDSALESFSDIPFAPSYDGGNEFGSTIAELAAGIEPLPQQFEDASTDLDAFSTSIDELTSDVTRLADDVGDVIVELEGTDELIGSYRTNIDDARDVAIDARDELSVNVSFIRLLLVVGGINLAVAQIVPFWLGRFLIRTTRTTAAAGTT
ncbi:hypothetical protein [Ilumatobacter sp.]|uniref:hypothetical protein n=1 Tax=Ilumatobacter sp. TaxID=1967498 RepID=UPI003B529E92